MSTAEPVPGAPLLLSMAGRASGIDQEWQQSGAAPQRSKLAVFCERFAVSVVFTIFVVFRAADRAFLYRVQKYLESPAYNLILSNLLWPVSIQLMTVAMLLCYILYLRSQGQTQYTWRFFLPGNVAASTMGAVPIYQLALFSIGDQINAAMSAPPSPYVSLPMQSIMSNFILVWMLGLAFVWLGTRFQQVHYIGCIIIILSVIVGVSDKVENSDCSEKGLQAGMCLTAFKDSAGVFKPLTEGSMALWYGLFVLSTVPSAVSNCYKQRVLKRMDVDVCYATWWSGNFQVLWGLLLFWVNWIPLPDQTVEAPGATFQLIADTWSCFLGNVPRPGDESCAAADGPAAKWFIIYLCFNLTFNICLLWLTKRMSAIWAQIATTLCLDLTNIFSQYRFIVGDSAEAMSLSQWMGTILASVALWTYNTAPEVRVDHVAGDAEPHRSHTLSSHGASMLADGRAQLIATLSFERSAKSEAVQHAGVLGGSSAVSASKSNVSFSATGSSANLMPSRSGGHATRV
eukprot:gnl/TRDRNA2_/TRDRNA2_157081_c0_seq1.p1 gnl/TRDRNA2_/TRDRNA2_157081_c0~~gnl/TRDRNA2_/TRDRNA2_157081_c0_seq1.p1  ORF type:complete len:536 (-),score=65.82 gnl/TRDRNA2_/TRDRNA2_157081_c0_seq1:11-1552(-)